MPVSPKKNLLGWVPWNGICFPGDIAGCVGPKKRVLVEPNIVHRPLAIPFVYHFIDDAHLRDTRERPDACTAIRKFDLRFEVGVERKGLGSKHIPRLPEPHSQGVGPQKLRSLFFQRKCAWHPAHKKYTEVKYDKQIEREASPVEGLDTIE